MQITLVTSQSRILDHMPPAASKHAAAWLQRRSVLLVLGQRAMPGSASGATPNSVHAPAEANSEVREDNGVVLDDGRHLTADIVFWCTGERPVAMAFPGLLAAASREQPGRDASGSAASCQVSSGRLRVLQSLQLAGAPNVFAAGDCAVAQGERTAFAAEISAGLAARNIIRLASGQPLLRFPEGGCARALHDARNCSPWREQQ